MKKVFASMLAIALAATMVVPAAAGLSTGEEGVVQTPVTNTSSTELTDNPSKGKDEGNYTIGVDGTYVAGTAAAEKISVDIAWDAMSFTYTAGDSTYHPENHKTTTADGTWSTNKAGITVTNHSNTDITAAFSFAPANGVTTTGTFYQKSGDDYTKAETDAAKKLMLDSAEGTTRSDTDATADKSPKDTIYFGVSGAPITENKTLGTITVTLATPVWTVVESATDLQTKLNAGGYIKLGDNMTFDTAIQLSNETATKTKVKLDLNGKTLTASVQFDGKYDVTVLDKTGTGKITCGDNVAIGLSGGAAFTLESGTVSGNDNAIYAEDSDVTINGGMVAGGTAAASGCYGIYCVASGNLTVTDGEIIGTTAISANDVTTNISGGTITGQCTGDGVVTALDQWGGRLTISGGTFDAGGRRDANERYSVYARASATITGGTFKQVIANLGTMIIDDCTMSGYSIVNDGSDTGNVTLTINGGEYNITTLRNANLNVGNTTTLNINGGTFTITETIVNDHDENGTVNITIKNADITANGIDNKGTMTVSNSTLSISGTSDNNFGTGILTLTTGTYSFDPTDYVDAENYTVTKNTDKGTWTVTAKA